ncbi:hypothetical protein FOL47_008729 [Perkinsus chesapeaki]|uniref:EF-hand domain-containing protein n=1 Tax=Perkinsus chesapeaki TaxID=330153 RepID=A0A7J6LC50_PERCH|nr:hypothetical protein FOL47_008729 [Perkinsus chesapeaki]
MPDISTKKVSLEVEPKLNPRNLTWPLNPKIKEVEFGGTITQLKAAGQPSGNVLLDFLKEQRLKLNSTSQKKNKTRTDWDKLHHVTFSKDNPVYSSYAREYFDKPIIPADTFYNMLVSQLGRSKEKRRRRSRSTPVLKNNKGTQAKQGDSSSGLPKLPPLRRRFNETNDLLKVPYKDTAWKPVADFPKGKWDPRGHIAVSKDNHLLHPGQRSYLDRMLPGWATTNDSVWRGLCSPVKREGDTLKGVRKEHAKGCWRHIRVAHTISVGNHTSARWQAVEGETVDKSRLKGRGSEYSKQTMEGTKSQAESVQSSNLSSPGLSVDEAPQLIETVVGRVAGRSTPQKDLLVASAVKLHYVLRGVKKQIEKRRRLLIGVLDPGDSALKNSEGQCTDRQKLWYVSYADFCHMLHTSGVNWLTKEQMRGAFKGVDLNNSGGLHLTELTQVIAVTDHDCKQILKGVVCGEEFLEEVLRTLLFRGSHVLEAEDDSSSKNTQEREFVMNPEHKMGDEKEEVPMFITPITCIPEIFLEPPHEEETNSYAHRAAARQAQNQAQRRRSLGDYIYRPDGTLVNHEERAEAASRGLSAETSSSEQRPSSKPGDGSRGTTRSSERYQDCTEGSNAESGDDEDSDVPAARELMAEYIDKLYHQNWAFAWFLELTRLSGVAQKVYVDRVLKSRPNYAHPYFPRLKHYIDSPAHERMMGFMVIVHCVFLAIQFSIHEDNNGLFPILDVVEQFFAVLFVFDLSLRILSYGRLYLLYTKWYLGEAVLAFLYCNGVWLTSNSRTADFFRILQALRIMRTIRVIKAVRVIPFFRVVWNMVRGLASSARTLFWTYVLIASILFVFSIFAVEIIARMEVFQSDISVQEYFGNVPRAMFTLFQVMTLDSWTAIARPMQAKAPGTVTVFFVAVILCVVMVLMNLITAVIVENAFSIAKADAEEQAKIREHKKQSEISSLAELFRELDSDGSGELTFEEFHQAVLCNRTVQNKLKVLDLDPNEMDELWTILDVSGDGSLTVEEFSNGLRRIKGDIQSKDLMENVKRVSVVTRKIEIARARLRRLQERTASLERMVSGTHTIVGKVVNKVNVCAEIVASCPRWNEHIRLKIARAPEGSSESSENPVRAIHQ